MQTEVSGQRHSRKTELQSTQCKTEQVREMAIALVDCNNFFVSCERVFRPELKGRPVVVLSNNDGCVISRSSEVKALGIQMGEPYFKIQKILHQFNIAVFSSNFMLYSDLSRRVMETLSQFSEKIEIYSIDEAFLHLTEGKNADGGRVIPSNSNLEDGGQAIQKKVYQWTGIPTSIGIGPTKSLAKAGAYFAKKMESLRGVCVLSNLKDQREALKHLPIEEVWGIGRSYSQFLKHQRIETAYAFTQAPEDWVRRKMGVVGSRLQQELLGRACLEIESHPDPKKGICTSRSFGSPIENLSELKEAVSHFVAQAAVKLRKEKLQTGQITVFISTSRFQPNSYFNSSSISLPYFTAFTPEMISIALEELRKIFRPGFFYKKAGVLLENLRPEGQASLFDPLDRTKANCLMKTVDHLNATLGRSTVRFGSEGIAPAWRPRAEHCSPRYTTDWKELPVIRI